MGGRREGGREEGLTDQNHLHPEKSCIDERWRRKEGKQQ